MHPQWTDQQENIFIPRSFDADKHYEVELREVKTTNDMYLDFAATCCRDKSFAYLCLVQGTSSDQDNRFSDKNKRLMKTMKFADAIAKKVICMILLLDYFWATICETVCPMLSDCCLSVCLSCLSCPVLSVCDVGVLWPNGWMDQDETWHADRPQPWPYCVRWGPSSPSPKRHSLLWPNGWMHQDDTWYGGSPQVFRLTGKNQICFYLSYTLLWFVFRRPF